MHNPMDKTDLLRAQLEQALRRIEALESAKNAQAVTIADTLSNGYADREPTAENKDNIPVADSGNTLDRRNAFFGLPRGGEVHAIYGGKGERLSIAKATKRKGGDDLWALVLAALDAGLLIANSINRDGKDNKLALRTLFPWMPRHHSYSRRFDLRNERDRATIRNDILPVAIPNKDKVMANPDLLETLVYQERQRRINQEIADKALANLGPHEQQIIMFGKRYWPRPDDKSGSYDYDQIVTAVCWFRHLNDSMFRSDPHSRAIMIRHSTKWISDFVQRRVKVSDIRWELKLVIGLVNSLATAMEFAPDADCRFPAYPHID